MNYILDIIIILICALTVFLGYKRGFFKSVMTLCTGVASFFVAYTFTPRLAALLKAKVFLSGLADSIAKTLGSIASTGDASTYDLSRLVDNDQFLTILKQYGANTEKINEIIANTADNTKDAVDKLSLTIADPIAQAISDVVAFILLFIATALVLKLITVVLGGLFRLPVLKTMDKMLGLVFGIASALLFVWIFALLAGSFIDTISVVAPGVISRDILDTSFLLKFFSQYNLIGVITGAIGI